MGDLAEMRLVKFVSLQFHSRCFKYRNNLIVFGGLYNKFDIFDESFSSVVYKDRKFLQQLKDAVNSVNKESYGLSKSSFVAAFAE